MAKIDKIAAAVMEDNFHCTHVPVYVGNHPVPWGRCRLNVDAESKAGVSHDE